MEILCERECSHLMGNPQQAFITDTCPRCLGSDRYRDISFDSSGKLITLTGVNQLNQQLKKILLENKRPSGYGFDYTLLQGIIDSGKILAIKREITRVINYYINNVQQVEKNSGFYYKTTEEVASLDSINISQDLIDPRKLLAVLNITTVSGQSQTIRISLKR